MNDQEMVLEALRISASAQVPQHLYGSSSEPSQAFPSSGAASCGEILTHCQAEGEFQALDGSSPNPELSLLKEPETGPWPPVERVKCSCY